MDKMVRRNQLDVLIEEFAGGTKAEFARMLNIPATRLQMWSHRGHMDVEMIAERFPTVSAEWLLRNIGAPFKDFVPTEPKENNDFDKKYNELQNRYNELREEYARIKEEKNALFDKLMKLI